MKNWWAVLFAVGVSLLASGVVFLVNSRPRGEPVELLPPPTHPPIQVHVTGAVLNPGVYTLPPESRIRDGIAAAGGAIGEADLDSINLAAFVADGDQIRVPFRQVVQNPDVGEHAQSAGDSPVQSVKSSSGKININTATQRELESLPGIGPVTAQKIITYRQENGSFTEIEAIQNVSGIGPATFEKLKDLITVE